MALTDESNMVMPVAPAYGGGYGNGGFGFGGDWAWILLLLLIGGNGWGMGGFGGGMMPFMMGGMAGGWDLYPWLNNSEHISDGFRDQMLQTSVSSLGDKITSGFGDVATQLCGGFAGVNAGIANAAAQAEIGANARQMSTMQQLFGIQSAQQQCCCDTRAGIADLKYTVATEACADRSALTQGIQTVLDKLCQLELDNERAQRAADQREIARLNSELMYARGQASQVEQTAALRASQATTANQLVSELRSCPIPSYSVYGNQPVFTCAGPTTGAGCGCGGNAFMN